MEQLGSLPEVAQVDVAGSVRRRKETIGDVDFLVISTDPAQRAWGKFTDSIRDQCRQRVEAEYGIEIVDIKIQRLNFPEQNRRNVWR